MSGAAHEVGPAGVLAGEGARRDEVGVLVGEPVELRHQVEVDAGQHPTAVGEVGVVPGQRRHDPVVHADVEVGEHEDRGLEPLGEVEGPHREVEALGRVGREQQQVLGVAVGCVGAGEDVALLGPGRHAGRRPGALHVDEHRRDLGVVAEAEQLVHERDAGAGRGRERAGAVPVGAENHAQRRELVLGLQDQVVVAVVDLAVGPVHGLAAVGAAE